MKVCISGLTASGKTTVSEALARDLRITHVQNSYKAYLRDNRGLADFIDKTDEDFVREFDRRTIEMAKKGDCVVSTWLSPWLIEDADLRIWLYAPLNVRIKRYMDRENIDGKEAERRVLEIDRSAAQSFKKFYNIDISELGIFDMHINTERSGIEDTVAIISLAMMRKDKNMFR